MAYFEYTDNRLNRVYYVKYFYNYFIYERNLVYYVDNFVVFFTLLYD